MYRLSSLLLLFSMGGALSAQTTTLPFTLRYQQGQNVTSLSDGSSVTLAADAVNAPVSGTLTITYRGTTNASINSIEISGSLDFTTAGLTPPVTLTAGESAATAIRFQPSTSARTTARLVVNWTEGRTTSTFTINLTGVAPEFAFSATPPGGNAFPLQQGATVSFPATPIDSTVNAVVVVTNRGSGPGTVNSIASTGAAFQLVGLPLPNTTVEPGRDIRFTVAFTPKQLAAVTGTVAIEMFGSRFTFGLEGSGTAAVFSYEVVQDTGVSVVLPDQAIAVPDIAVGEKSSVTVRVRNTGNADGRIAAIGVSGAGFTLADAPFLPLTLTPGGGFTISVVFTPTQVGRATGRLRIGADNFDLSASGLGPVLTYAFVVAGVSTTIQNNGSVIFTPTAVGASSTAEFRISNTGSASTSVTSISISGASTAFELARAPSLPLRLEAGASASFSIVFTPTVTGSAAATLRVDTQTFTLSGAATPPAPLPDYRFDGATGPQEPLQQPAVGLRLASPYALPLTGTLTLAFNSDVFSNDPAVQFATGGRTVSFTIPANTTTAVFPNNATQIRVQTGSVAGTISLTPSFNTDSGINLTPTRPASLNLTVASLAPRILTAAVSARTANSITLLVTGYATSRAVTQMDLQFTPTPGENVSTTRLSINVEPTFLAWYQGAQSQQFGSLFTATVPLSFQGDVTNVVSLPETIQSISVTLTNRIGTSPARAIEAR